MDTRKITNVSLLTGISLFLMMTVRFPLFQPFLIYEPGDLPILMISFLYGPATGLSATLLLSILMALFTGLGGPFGAFMHFLATGILVGVAGHIYQKKHTLKGAIVGLIFGSVMMTAIMSLANYTLNPIFYGIPREAISKIMLPAIVPFNIVKGLINSGLTLLVYKKLADFLRERGLLHSSEKAEEV